MTARGRLITPTVITPTVISATLITPTVITPTVINTPTLHPGLCHHILSNHNSKQLNRIIARSRYWKYDHECRKTHQIKRVCGTCYAHEFNLNAFRHEWSYIQYSRRAIEYRYYIYFIDENKRYSRKFRWTMFSVFLRVNVYLATSLRTYVLIIPFNVLLYCSEIWELFIRNFGHFSLVEGCIHTVQKIIWKPDILLVWCFTTNFE